jgi:hypothetical protein
VNNVNKIVLSLRPVAAATALMTLGMLGAGAAWAGDDDVPLSLSLSHDIRHDNNFAKDDNNKYGETVNATSASADLNKAYGRQTYQGGFRLTREQYNKHEQLNNNGKDAHGNFTTEIGKNWLFALGGNYTQSLNPIQNNVDVNRVEKNIKTYKGMNTSVQYGNGGRWAVLVTYEGDKLGYSAASQQFQDYKQRRVGLKGIYYSTDILSYSLGTERSVTTYATNPNYNKIMDRDISLSIDYKATGSSLFDATVSRRATSYDPPDLAGSKSWTGSATWLYTPQGIMTYSASFLRATGTDRQKIEQDLIVDTLISRINNKTTTTSLNLAAKANLTGKTSVQLSHSIAHYNIDHTENDSFIYSGALDPNSNSYSSYGHTTSLSLDYAALRSVVLGCSVQRYTQGHDLYRLKYSGNSIGCNARFTINP